MTCCAGKVWTGLLVSTVWDKCQYYESNRSFFAELIRLSPLTATISKSYATSLFFPGGFLNQNVYSNNPSSPEDLEYSIEWAFAGTCYKLLSLKKKNFRVNACLKVWDTIIVCCNHTYMSHSWLSLKKNEIKWIIYSIEWRFMQYIVYLQRTHLVVLKKL